MRQTIALQVLHYSHMFWLCCVNEKPFTAKLPLSLDLKPKYNRALGLRGTLKHSIFLKNMCGQPSSNGICVSYVYNG